MKKIGLVMACCSNYGALLQSYATQQIVKRYGFTTEIIIYESPRYNKCIKFDFGLIPFVLDYLFHKIRTRRLVDINDTIHLKNKKERKEVMLRFCNERLENRHTYKGYKALCEAAKKCDAVLIGSDQMWQPGFSFGNHISLRFVPETVRTISYATSLGVSEFPKYCWHSSRSVWKRINYLSVREEQGKKIIQKICGNINVSVLVDPTYLLTKSDWVSIIPYNSLEQEKYVLCYFLGNDETSFACAKRFAQSRNLKILTILSDESSAPSDCSFADRVIIGASVEDFINLIRNAEYIFTDSFHGTAFSVINEKQFYVMYRKNELAKKSRNSRIDNILKLWKLEDRIITNKELDWNVVESHTIDYSAVNELVELKRRESFSFLDKAFMFNEDTRFIQK